MNTFYFDGWVASERQRTVAKRGRRVYLRPKCFDLLLLLLRNANQTVPATEVVRYLWPGQMPNYGSVPQAVSELREALQDWDSILSIRGVGYRLTAYVRSVRDDVSRIRDISTIDPGLAKTYAEAQKYALVSGIRMYRSIKGFREILDVCPDFAPAYSGLAGVYFSLAMSGFEQCEPLITQAQRFAEKALELDATSTAAAWTLANIQLCVHHRSAEAQAVIRKVQRFGGALADIDSAWYFLLIGKHDEAGAVLERRIDLDPSNLATLVNLGSIDVFRGRFTAARARLGDVIARDPAEKTARFFLGRALIHEGRYAEGIIQVSRASDGIGRHRGLIGHAHARMGQSAAAERIARDVFRYSLAPNFESAMIAAGFQEKRSAIEFLERAVEREPHSMPSLGFDPCFEPLRQTDGFRRLRERTRSL